MSKASSRITISPSAMRCCEHAQKASADLLAMGAYGHSRLREMILGGATRDVPGQATIPVLMAH